MITRTSRPPTTAERSFLTQPVRTRTVHRTPLLTSAVLLLVPGLGLGALVAALLWNINFFHGMARGILLLLMAITGVIALYFTWRALANIFTAIRPAPAPTPLVSDADARTLTLTEVRLTIHRAWMIDIGDDDVAWYLLLCGDRYVSLRSSVLDEIRSDTDGSEMDHLTRDMTIVLWDAAILSIRQHGPEIPRDVVSLSEVPWREPSWCLLECAEVSRADLWPELAAKLGE